MRQFAMLLTGTVCRSDAPRGFWTSIDRRCATGSSARTMMPIANCFVRWPRKARQTRRRSVPTLIGLAGLAAGLYAAQGLLDLIPGTANLGFAFETQPSQTTRGAHQLRSNKIGKFLHQRIWPCCNIDRLLSPPPQFFFGAGVENTIGAVDSV